MQVIDFPRFDAPSPSNHRLEGGGHARRAASMAAARPVAPRRAMATARVIADPTGGLADPAPREARRPPFPASPYRSVSGGVLKTEGEIRKTWDRLLGVRVRA